MLLQLEVERPLEWRRFSLVLLLLAVVEADMSEGEMMREEEREKLLNSSTQFALIFFFFIPEAFLV